MSIAEKYLNLMRQGICPNCVKKIKTHDKEQMAKCEKEFRDKVGIHHADNFVLYRGKYYRVDARYEPKT